MKKGDISPIKKGKTPLKIGEISPIPCQKPFIFLCNNYYKPFKTNKVMSNLTNNRINTTATAAQITGVKTAIQAINTNLPFLIGLTIGERIALPAINVNNKAFTEDAIMAMVNNANLVPTYLSVPNMQADLTLFSQLDELIIITKQLLERLEDTQLLAGSEAYVAALTSYKAIGGAADAGVAGADTLYSQLKARFANNGAGTTTISTPPTP